MREIRAVAALAAITWLTTACGGETHDVSSRELNIYTWTEYLPDSVVEGFEQQYGVTVNLNFYDSNEEAIRGLEDDPGLHDIVIPSDYAVEILIDREMLEEIDPTEDIQNFGNIETDFQSPFFDPGNPLRVTRGKEPEPKYTVPYQWGTTGIVYDETQVSSVPQTWADVAQPEFTGRVALIEDAREVLGAGLIATGHDKNDASPEALEQAQAWVSSLAALPVNADNPEQPLVDGEAVIGIMYNGNAAEAIRANPNFRYVLPEQGGIWFDNIAIPRNAPHRDAALAFIDYVLEPEVGAQITQFFGYSTPNGASLDLLVERNDPSVSNEATNPPRDALLGLLLTKDVGLEGSERFELSWQEVRP